MYYTVFSDWKIETGKDEVMCGRLYRKHENKTMAQYETLGIVMPFMCLETLLKKPRRNNNTVYSTVVPSTILLQTILCQMTY